jgi:hypothetical protein
LSKTESGRGEGRRERDLPSGVEDEMDDEELDGEGQGGYQTNDGQENPRVEGIFGVGGREGAESRQDRTATAKLTLFQEKKGRKQDRLTSIERWATVAAVHLGDEDNP